MEKIMDKINSIDIKVALFFSKCINYYINKRTYVPLPPSNDKIWDSLFVTNDTILHELKEGVKIKLYKSSILSKLIYFGFERAELSFLTKFLKEGDTFIDIGSNIGLYSIYASDLVGERGRILAFEPTPEIFIRLCDNVQINGLLNIEPINMALSNKSDFVDFNVSLDGHDAWNSFAKLEELEMCKKIKVKVNTLDSFVDERRLDDINLIKVDVEGWEKFVLEGSRKLLSSEKSPVFIVEFTEKNAFAAGYYCGELYDYIKTFGFNWYCYEESKNSLNPVEKKLHYPYENLFAIKDINACLNRIKKND